MSKKNWRRDGFGEEENFKSGKMLKRFEDAHEDGHKKNRNIQNHLRQISGSNIGPDELEDLDI